MQDGEDEPRQQAVWRSFADFRALHEQLARETGGRFSASLPRRSLLQQLMDLRRSLGQPASLLVLVLAFSVAVAGVPVPDQNPAYPAYALAAPTLTPAPQCAGIACVLQAVLGAAPLGAHTPRDTRLGRARLLL